MATISRVTTYETTTNLNKPQDFPIYCPKIPVPVKDDFKDLLPRIDSITSKNLKIFGFSYVQSKKTNKWVPVVIMEQIRNLHLTVFFIYHVAGNTLSEIGAAFAYPEFNNRTPEIFLGSIHVGENKTFKYRGYLLIKTIQQKFKETSKGRIYLESKPEAIGFYEKMGFTHSHEKIYKLTPKLQAEWLKEIEHNPIPFSLCR